MSHSRFDALVNNTCIAVLALWVLDLTAAVNHPSLTTPMASSRPDWNCVGDRLSEWLSDL